MKFNLIQKKESENNHPAHPLYLKKDLKPELWKK